MLKLNCPHCGFTAENIPDKYAGKTVKCPKCKQGGVRIPDFELELDETAPEMPAAPVSPVRQSPASELPIAEKQSDNSQPIRQKDAPASQSQPGALPPLWNPNTAGCLSLFLTPIFGSILIYQNWKALKESERAQTATIWLGISGGLTLFSMFLWFLIPVYMVYIFIWYWGSVKPQSQYFDKHFDNKYPGRNLFPAFIAAALLFCFVCYGMFSATSFVSRLLFSDSAGNNMISQLVEELMPSKPRSRPAQAQAKPAVAPAVIKSENSVQSAKESDASEDDDEMPGLGDSELMPLTAESMKKINELLGVNKQKYSEIYKKMEASKAKNGKIENAYNVEMTDFFIEILSKNNWNYEATLYKYIQAYQNKDTETIAICNKENMIKLFASAIYACYNDKTPKCDSLKESIHPFYRKEIVKSLQTDIFKGLKMSTAAASSTSSGPEERQPDLGNLKVMPCKDDKIELYYILRANNNTYTSITRKMLESYEKNKKIDIKYMVEMTQFLSGIFYKAGYSYDASLSQYVDSFIKGENDNRCLDTSTRDLFTYAIQVCQIDKTDDCKILEKQIHRYYRKKIAGVINSGVSFKVDSFDEMERIQKKFNR